MKQSKLILAAVASVAILASCQKDDSNSDNGSSSTMRVNNNSEELNKRVTVFNEPIQLSNKRSAPNYVKIASVAPNTINGNQLSATSVGFKANKVYVTYHVRGDQYGAELLTFNVSDHDNPWVDQSVTDATSDFNDLTVSSSNIWLAGAKKRGAMAWKMPLTSFNEPTGVADWELKLESSSANSIERVDNASPHEIWITSGRTGGLFVADAINPDGWLHSRSAVNNAKHFDADGSVGVLFDGEGAVASIDVYDLDNPYTFTTHYINVDVTLFGKNAIRVEESSNSVFIAAGDDGVRQIDLATGNTINSYNHNGAGFANSLTFDDNYVYVANGADGLLILDKNTFDLEGQYDYDGSCNYVAKNGSHIYMANGDTDGLIIIEEL